MARSNDLSRVTRGIDVTPKPLGPFRRYLALRRFKRSLMNAEHWATPGWRRRCWNVVRDFKGTARDRRNVGEPFPFQRIPSSAERYNTPDQPHALRAFFDRVVRAFLRLTRWPDEIRA